jgi:PhoH-like ATPase
VSPPAELGGYLLEITRAGTGTKIICIGNLAQIDTPYLTATSSGLTYVVDMFIF